MATAYNNTFIFASNGVYSWGTNQYGQLGNGNTDIVATPINFANSDIWKSFSVGRIFSVGLKNDGTVWAWGDNSVGELGNGTTVSSNIPVQVGNDNDWIAISAGNHHTLALKSNGTLWGWGSNHTSQLAGSSADLYSTVPVQLVTDSDWEKICAGYFRSFGIKQNGTLWGWGSNYEGQIGVGTNYSVYQITQIGGDSNWQSIEANNGATTIALKQDGTLWAWGNNEQGQMGNGTTYPNQNTPIQIGTDTWMDIAVGAFFCAGLKSDGSLWHWGSYPPVPSGPTPTQFGNDTDWKEIAAGNFYAMALKNDNSLWGWGSNYNGQLGIDNEMDYILTATQILGCNLGIKEHLLPNVFIYPNPASKVLFVKGNIPFRSFKIHDISGKLIISGNLENKNKIHINRLPEGMYFVTLQHNELKNFIFKFIKINF